MNIRYQWISSSNFVETQFLRKKRMSKAMKSTRGIKRELLNEKARAKDEREKRGGERKGREYSQQVRERN